MVDINFNDPTEHFKVAEMMIKDIKEKRDANTRLSLEEFNKFLILEREIKKIELILEDKMKTIKELEKELEIKNEQ